MAGVGLCVYIEGKGGVNLIPWKRGGNRNYKEGISLLLFPLPRSRGLSLREKKQGGKKMSAAFC